MSYVYASYISVFGTVGVYAARLFIRARTAAAQVIELEKHSASSSSVDL
jgi:hypothetical protein